MNVLIAMAVYSTAENKKDECLEKTLRSLSETINYRDNTIALSVNAFTEETERIIKRYGYLISYVYYNETNLGTAEAINRIWKNRQAGQHCIKMDDDVVIHNSGWLDLMVEAIERKPDIGIIGLKRKDCWENPSHSDPQYKTEFLEIPHKAGEKWIIVERAHHVMGTCQLYNSALLDKIGYLYQPKLYGFDDVLASYRSEIAGFQNVFLTHVEIDHIDAGQTEYQGWKERHSGEQFPVVNQLVNDYISGATPIYYNPFK